ncbi:SET domain-containing protein [Biscogniauxia mediterranea]|nr:SET domain-containing protein [Biscogniauxia mediterranea]
MVHEPTDSPSIEDMDIALFSMTDIPGRGKGLVARTNIPKGTCILCEKPLFTVNGPMPPDALETFVVSKLASLSREEQRQFLSLHNSFRGKYPFGGIVRTNALPCGAGSSVGGVYTTICRINHSCLPNCHNSWNSDTKHETIHAIRPIEAGEEITIRYDKGGSLTARQAFLKESFGFQCDCVQCSLPPPMLKASDSRRESIQRLDDSIGDPWGMLSNPITSLGDCYSLLQVLREEFDGYPEVLLGRLYYDAFQICITHGDQARAAIFAQKAYEARVICEGEDSPETQNAKSLAAKPSSHRSYGQCSMKWKTKKEMAPKGLDSDQMEKWLFRK